jgi:hypothetical protein
VTDKKRTARKPLLKCRKRRDDVKTAGDSLLRDQAPTNPVYRRSGIWHERWPELPARRLAVLAESESARREAACASGGQCLGRAIILSGGSKLSLESARS